MTDLAALAGLFAVSLMAATVLPMGSEPALVGLIASGAHSPWVLVGVASIGNVLGSLLNWLLGLWIEHFGDRRWFPVSPEALARAQAWYGRWGRWSLLLSWAPFIGDPLTIAAGVLRERLVVFLALVGFAKTARYALLAYATLNGPWAA